MMGIAQMAFEWVCGRKGIVVLCLCFAATTACNRLPQESAHTHGQHGGHILKLSKKAKFEFELTADEKQKRIVLYVQEAITHRPFPLPLKTLLGKIKSGGKEYDVAFESDPRPTDPQDSSSRFFLSLESLPQQATAFEEFGLTIGFSFDGSEMNASIFHRNDHNHQYKHD